MPPPQHYSASALTCPKSLEVAVLPYTYGRAASVDVAGSRQGPQPKRPKFGKSQQAWENG